MPQYIFLYRRIALVTNVHLPLLQQVVTVDTDRPKKGAHGQNLIELVWGRDLLRYDCGRNFRFGWLLYIIYSTELMPTLSVSIVFTAILPKGGNNVERERERVSHVPRV